MSDLVTIRAVVGTDPQLTVTAKGVAVLKFRAATHERKKDQESGQWVDGPTNWYSISAFRGLAENTMESLAQGDHVMVFGKLQIREFERADGTKGNSADIEAYSIGHDLRFGTSSFARVRTEAGDFERISHQDSSTEAEGSWPKGGDQAA